MCSSVPYIVLRPSCATIVRLKILINPLHIYVSYPPQYTSKNPYITFDENYIFLPINLINLTKKSNFPNSFHFQKIAFHGGAKSFGSSRWKLFINPSSFENSPAVERRGRRTISCIRKRLPLSSWRAGYAVYANRMRGVPRAEYKWSAICHHLGANRPSLLFLPPRTCHQVDKLETEPLSLSLSELRVAEIVWDRKNYN